MNDRTIKTKLCWSCEGRVSQDIENCPFCGVYLSPTPQHIGKGDPIVPLYAKEPKNPFKKVQEPELAPKEEKKSQHKEILIPMIALLSGAVFLLFGIALFLFGDEDGNFTLKWNAGLWPIYLGLSAAMLFFGYRMLNQLQD